MHNAADGITLGVAVSQSLALGLSTAFAIVLHEIPHEMGKYYELTNDIITVLFW